MKQLSLYMLISAALIVGSLNAGSAWTPANIVRREAKALAAARSGNFQQARALANEFYNRNMNVLGDNIEKEIAKFGGTAAQPTPALVTPPTQTPNREIVFDLDEPIQKTKQISPAPQPEVIPQESTTSLDPEDIFDPELLEESVEQPIQPIPVPQPIPTPPPLPAIPVIPVVPQDQSALDYTKFNIEIVPSAAQSGVECGLYAIGNGLEMYHIISDSILRKDNKLDFSSVKNGELLKKIYPNENLAQVCKNWSGEQVDQEILKIIPQLSNPRLIRNYSVLDSEDFKANLFAKPLLTQQQKDNIEKLIRLEKDAFHLFILGNMRQNSDPEGKVTQVGGGHWIAVVARVQTPWFGSDKKELKLYIADSLNGITKENAKNDPRIINLSEYLRNFNNPQN